MKRILLFAMAALFACNAFAQNNSDERGFTAGIMFGLSQTHHDNFINKKNHIGVIVTPRLGYRFNSSWEAGALFRYEKFSEDLNYYGIGGYGEYSFLHFNNGLRMFVDLQAYHSFPGTDIDGGNEESFTEVGFVPGVAYRIGNSPVDLKLRYLFVGFNHGPRYYKSEAPGCLGRGDFILDAALRRLEIGVSVTF